MRILHTMLRVGDLKRSIAFYTEVLGMRVLRQSDYPNGRFTLAFVGYGEESEESVLELTHNWDTAEDYRPLPDCVNARATLATAVRLPATARQSTCPGHVVFSGTR